MLGRRREKTLSYKGNSIQPKYEPPRPPYGRTCLGNMCIRIHIHLANMLEGSVQYVYTYMCIRIHMHIASYTCTKGPYNMYIRIHIHIATYTCLKGSYNMYTRYTYNMCIRIHMHIASYTCCRYPGYLGT